MSAIEYIWNEIPPSPTCLTWSTLLPREDSQDTRASISRRLDFLEKRIRRPDPSPAEIVQACNDPLENTNWSDDLAGLKTTIQTILILLIHASIKTGYIGWLNDESLHYRLRLLDVPASHYKLKDDALQREIYSSTITTLKNIASARTRDTEFMKKPLKSLPHCVPTNKMLGVGRGCKDSGSAMMRKLFYIATAYTVPSPCNYTSSHDRCEDTECSHIDCQLHYTSPN